MSNLSGSILISSALMDDVNFQRSVVLIVSHDADGAIGYVTNRQFPRHLNELAEFVHSRAFPLYEGGPVEKDNLYFIHRRPDLIEGGTPVSGDLRSGGNFQQVIANINARALSENDLKIFIGYCGWDQGELETEIDEGSWIIKEKSDVDIFGNIEWENVE